MSFKGINYSSAAIQFSMSIFLLIWLVIEIQRLEKTDTDQYKLEFPIGEYNGQLGQLNHGPMFNIPVYVIVLLLLLFTLVTGGVHIFYARSNKRYQSQVERGLNSMRWLEYSITATIMIFVIAITCGVASLDSLVLISISTICCMICGYLSEQTAISKRNVSILSTLVGWLLLVGVFSIIIRRFYSIVTQTSGTTDGPPSWVWAIVIGMTILFTSFGFIHLVHMRRQWSSTGGATKSFNNGVERAYTVASMVSKISLVVLLASGLFARNMAEAEETN